MLTSCRIRNHPPFEELHFDQLARINLFVGDNGSGKSSTLRAIGHLAGCAVNPVAGSAPSPCEWTLADPKAAAWPARVVHLTAGRSAGPTEVARMAAIDAQPDRIDELCTAMRVVEPQLADVRLNRALAPAGDHIACDIGLPDRVDLNQLGGGAVFLARLALAIIDAAGGIVLVDGIAHNIHHAKLATFWKRVASLTDRHDAQLFAVTHSYECVTAALQECGNLRVQRIEKHPATGGVAMVSYSDEALAAAVRRNMEIR